MQVGLRVAASFAFSARLGNINHWLTLKVMPRSCGNHAAYYPKMSLDLSSLSTPVVLAGKPMLLQTAGSPRQVLAPPGTRSKKNMLGLSLLDLMTLLLCVFVLSFRH